VTNMTRGDAREYLALAARIALRPRVQLLPLQEANTALVLLKADRVDGAVVLIP
jgi:propanol-preferring alcohol dehydrogenase